MIGWLPPMAHKSRAPAQLVPTLIDELRRRRILLPSAAVLEMIVHQARTRAESTLHRALVDGLSTDARASLDRLLEQRSEETASHLAWLRSAHQSPAARNLLGLAERVRIVRTLEIDRKRRQDIPAQAFERLADEVEAQRREGRTAMFVAIDGLSAGLVSVEDAVKPSTREAIRMLHEEGLRIVMLTGDSRTTADAVARALGIDEVVAEVLPDQKGEVIKRLQAEGRVVAMAGDGINDAPALAQADVGIAMGTGADVAMESASVTLIQGDLRGIARARRLSRATMRNIRQNLFFAFAYNVIGVPLAAGLLYPIFGVLLSPMVASAAMSLSSVSVIANALRLRKARL